MRVRLPTELDGLELYLRPGAGAAMMTLGASVFQSALAVDRTRVRPWSGLRRATVLTIVLIGVGAAAGPIAAVNAAMGAFIVGLFDRRQPTKSLAKMSFYGTLVLTAVSLVAGLTDERILVVAALMAALAFSAGVCIAISQSALVVLVLSSLSAATGLLSPAPPSQAWSSAVATGVGDFAQLAGVRFRARPEVATPPR